MLVAQKDAITKITGIITPEFIDTLMNKLGGAFTIIKSTHFVDGQRYGFLASVIPQEKYRVVISNPAWVYVAPANPGAYSAAALVAGVSAAQQEQLIAQHKEAQTTYANSIGTQEAGKELLLYGVGANALVPLKKQYINFDDVTIHSMILHLREKTAIKMTTLQKYKYKTEGYKTPWDPTTSITAYFTGLEKFKNSLANRGIATSVKEMTMAARARMWESKMFTKDQLVLWENKPAANQTWQALPPGLLHGEVAGTLPIFAGDGKALPLQGRCPRCTRTGGSQGGKQSVGNDVCTTTRAAQDATRGNVDGEPKGNGSNVRTNKHHQRCPMQGGGQGEHAAHNWQHGQKHRWDKVEQKKVHPLWKVRIPQALRLLRA
jgi:hypothetical protein